MRNRTLSTTLLVVAGLFAPVPWSTVAQAQVTPTFISVTNPSTPGPATSGANGTSYTLNANATGHSSFWWGTEATGTANGLISGTWSGAAAPMATSENPNNGSSQATGWYYTPCNFFSMTLYQGFTYTFQWTGATTSLSVVLIAPSVSSSPTVSQQLSSTIVAYSPAGTGTATWHLSGTSTYSFTYTVPGTYSGTGAGTSNGTYILCVGAWDGYSANGTYSLTVASAVIPTITALTTPAAGNVTSASCTSNPSATGSNTYWWGATYYGANAANFDSGSAALIPGTWAGVNTPFTGGGLNPGNGPNLNWQYTACNFYSMNLTAGETYSWTWNAPAKCPLGAVLIGPVNTAASVNTQLGGTALVTTGSGTSFFEPYYGIAYTVPSASTGTYILILGNYFGGSFASTYTLTFSTGPVTPVLTPLTMPSASGTGATGTVTATATLNANSPPTLTSGTFWWGATPTNGADNGVSITNPGMIAGTWVGTTPPMPTGAVPPTFGWSNTACNFYSMTLYQGYTYTIAWSGATTSLCGIVIAPSVSASPTVIQQLSSTLAANSAASSGTLSGSTASSFSITPAITTSFGAPAGTYVLCIGGWTTYNNSKTNYSLSITAAFSVAAANLPTSQTVTVDNGTFNVNVTLSHAPAAQVTVPLTVGGTAVYGTDYTMSPAPSSNVVNAIVPTTSSIGTVTVTFLTNPGATNKTITFAMGTPSPATSAVQGTTTSYTLTIAQPPLGNPIRPIAISSLPYTDSSRDLLAVNFAGAGYNTVTGSTLSTPGSLVTFDINYSENVGGWKPLGSYQCFYQVTLAANTLYTISQTRVSGSDTPFICIYNSTGTTQLGYHESGSISFNGGPSGGTYLIMCSEVASASLTYTLTVSAGTPAQAIAMVPALGVNNTGTINYFGVMVTNANTGLLDVATTSTTTINSWSELGGGSTTAYSTGAMAVTNGIAVGNSQTANNSGSQSTPTNWNVRLVYSGPEGVYWITASAGVENASPAVTVPSFSTFTGPASVTFGATPSYTALVSNNATGYVAITAVNTTTGTVYGGNTAINLITAGSNNTLSGPANLPIGSYTVTARYFANSPSTAANSIFANSTNGTYVTATTSLLVSPALSTAGPIVGIVSNVTTTPSAITLAGNFSSAATTTNTTVTFTNGSNTVAVVPSSVSSASITVTPPTAQALSIATLPNSGTTISVTINSATSTNLTPTYIYDSIITLTPSTLANGTVNVSSYSVTSSGGTAPVTFSLSAGALPSGLTLSGNTLSGTAGATGTFNFTITATDADGVTATQAYTVTINPAVAITTTSLPGSTANVTGYNQTIVATGGTGALSLTVSAGTLPTGLTLSSSGALTGTPTAAGSFSFTVMATDTVGASATSSYSVIIIPSAPTLSAAAGIGQVVLTWTASTGATSYTIYRGAASGSEVSYATTTSTTYTDTGTGTGGITYWYTVAAVAPSGTSTFSNEVSALPSPATPNFVYLGNPSSSPAGCATSGSLYAGSYQGSQATTSQSGAHWAPLGCYQDWYTISLTGGTTYVISMQTTGNSFLSIEDKSGTQVGWNDDVGTNSISGNPLASQVVFTPAATDTYTIICSTELPGIPLTYTLTIPNPAPPVATISVPYPTAPLTLTSASYIGAAAATDMGTPTGGWVDHQQQWYSVFMTASDTYSITLAATGSATAVLSIQNPSNDQVGFATGSTASIVYTPGVSGTYTIICSQSSISNATANFTLTIPAPIVPVVTTIAITASSVLSPSNATVIVAVTATAGGTPTGVVTLTVDNGLAMTQTLSNGSASFTVTSPSFGSHTLSVSYPGAIGFQAATQTGVLSVGVPNVKLAPGAGTDHPSALRQRRESTPGDSEIITSLLGGDPRLPSSGTPGEGAGVRARRSHGRAHCLPVSPSPQPLSPPEYREIAENAALTPARDRGATPGASEYSPS